MSQARLVDVYHDIRSAAFHLARAVCGRGSGWDDEPNLICAGSLTSEHVCPCQQEYGEAIGWNLPPSRP
jgi:hypothetical protein